MRAHEAGSAAEVPAGNSGAHNVPGVALPERTSQLQRNTEVVTERTSWGARFSGTSLFSNLQPHEPEGPVECIDPAPRVGGVDREEGWTGHQTSVSKVVCALQGQVQPWKCKA